MAVARNGRVCTSQQSELHIKPLSDPDTLTALRELHRMFKSCYGPAGKLKLLHNNTGGHVTVTSSSGRLLHGLTVTKPVIKLLKSVIQEHLMLFSDCGTLTGLLSLALINSSLKLDLNRHLLTDIHEVVCKWCIEALEREDCACKVQLAITDFDALLNVVGSVMRSKPGCSLYGKDRDHICNLVLDAFLRTFQSEGSHSAHFGSVRYVSFEGLHPSSSQIIDGILFPSPNVPAYAKACIHAKCGENGLIKVALFNISLSGDSEQYIDATYELREGLDLSEIVLEKIKDCVDGLVQDGVGLIACQKVVHPTVKKQCKEQGVLVLDRLGFSFITALHHLTG